MKVIITGSKPIQDPDLTYQIIKESGFNITEVVSGAGRGPDYYGRLWAQANNIPIKQFVPDWGGESNEFMKRHVHCDRHMINYADAVIAIWDGKSKRTKNIIDLAIKKKRKLYLKIVGDYNGCAQF